MPAAPTATLLVRKRRARCSRAVTLGSGLAIPNDSPNPNRDPSPGPNPNQVRQSRDAFDSETAALREETQAEL
eukprot:scaffold84477_cov39-Phaeocystis_antarctica.AAC.2